MCMGGIEFWVHACGLAGHCCTQMDVEGTRHTTPSKHVSLSSSLLPFADCFWSALPAAPLTSQTNAPIVHLQPLAATGSCCNPTSGSCQNDKTQAECASPAVWTEGGVCGVNGVCMGACCSAPGGTCSQTLASACPAGGSWLYGAPCTADTCAVCTSAWQTCEPCVGAGCKDPCCAGNSCQMRRYGKTHRSSYGRPAYVCMPEKQCSAEGGLCGNCYGGGACCDGLVCRWNKGSKVGVCSAPEKWSCAKKDAGCSSDDECCAGCVCSGRKCMEAVCDSDCSYLKRCKGDKSRVCDASAAAYASSA